MRKHRPVGAYVQLSIPTNPRPLPNNALEVLRDIIVSGMLYASSFWRKRQQLTEQDFIEHVNRFKNLSDGNEPYFHLLMVGFLETIQKEFKKKNLHQIKKRNCFMIGGMVQRELTQMCLTMCEQDLENYPTWLKFVIQFDDDFEVWLKDYRGALGAARLARLCMQEGLKVFLPSVFIDIQWRIDLIAHSPKEPFGMCVQAKSSRSDQLVTYRLFHHLEAAKKEELQDNDRLFVDGVSFFRNQNIGLWIPIEITIGDTVYEPNEVSPPQEMRKSFQELLASVREIHATTS
jgi:hypothetical protein